jgi:hypothetical protein
MPQSMHAREEKNKLLTLLIANKNDLRRRFRGRDWYVSKSGNFEVFLTFSHDGQLWYDMDQTDLRQLKTSGYIIFLLGGSERFLCVPAIEICNRISQHTRGLTEHGRYMLHVNDGGTSVKFHELPNWELHGYINNLDSFKYGKT